MELFFFFFFFGKKGGGGIWEFRFCCHLYIYRVYECVECAEMKESPLGKPAAATTCYIGTTTSKTNERTNEASVFATLLSLSLHMPERDVDFSFLRVTNGLPGRLFKNFEKRGASLPIPTDPKAIYSSAAELLPDGP